MDRGLGEWLHGCEASWPPEFPPSYIEWLLNVEGSDLTHSEGTARLSSISCDLTNKVGWRPVSPQTCLLKVHPLKTGPTGGLRRICATGLQPSESLISFDFLNLSTYINICRMMLKSCCITCMRLLHVRIGCLLISSYFSADSYPLSLEAKVATICLLRSSKVTNELVACIASCCTSSALTTRRVHL